MSYVFTSYDGRDAQGNRAEVRVEIGEGIVKEIVRKDKSAQILIDVEKLTKGPVKAWVGMNTEAFAEAEKALASKEVVSYRIEQFRKSGVERDTPIEELRKDMPTASKNTTRVFALFNGKASGEGVTNINEDSTQNPTGRYIATDADMDTSPAASSAGNQVASASPAALLASLEALSDLSPATDVLAAAIGAAIALGADPIEVFKVAGGKDRAEGEERPAIRSSFASEAPQWKEWNSDGRPNLGHLKYSSGIGAESFVRSQLVKKGAKEEGLEAGVEFFAKLILSIADGVQTKAYGQGSQADRGSTSHGKIRGIIYDTVNNYIPLPYPLAEGENANEAVHKWIISIGSTTFERFEIALNASDSRKSFNDALPELLYGKQVVTSPAVSEAKPTVTAKPVVEKKVEAPQLPVEEKVEAPAPAVEEVALEDNEELGVYEQVNLKDLPSEKQHPLATTETIEELTAFVAETGLESSEYALVGNLIKYTFGPETKGQAKNVPDPVLADFLEYYISAGEENFVNVLRAVPKQ
jgi:hypothetical protein